MTHVEEETADKSIYHKNLMPVVYVTADVAGAVESPVYAIFKINEALDKLVLPGGYKMERYVLAQPGSDEKLSMKWDGEWHITYEVFRDLGLAFAAVLVLIYILVVGWFQSFIIPVTIMAAIPFSLVGILPAHGFMGAFFTATSMIGFIAGAGIVVRNSIILVDFIELRLEAGDAARPGGDRRGSGPLPADAADRGRRHRRRLGNALRPDLPGSRDLADGGRSRLAAAVADDGADPVLRHREGETPPQGAFPGEHGGVGSMEQSFGHTAGDKKT